jgi:hypothetical protein
VSAVTVAILLGSINEVIAPGAAALGLLCELDVLAVDASVYKQRGEVNKVMHNNIIHK